MTSLLSRTVVLSFSRFANQAIVMLSPLVLVRLLTVEEYGKYHEFLLYAALIGPLVTFGIGHSLIYFIPKHPERERVWITQGVLYALASSIVAVLAIMLARDLIRANTSFDFVTALQLYILFYFNLNFLESYWLAKKRTDYVFYYSSVRLTVRVIVVITAALLTEKASTIIASLVVLEALRFLIVLVYASVKRWFTLGISRSTVAYQMSYFLPLGAGAIIEILNWRAGMLFISTTIGAAALAFFVTGAFATQIVNVLRGAIADVIFPEIVELKHAIPKDALPLWQRATVWYCVMLFPMAILFSYYADAIVTVLFTQEYAAAIPVFATFGLVLYLYCFDFHLPLRVQNENRFFLVGSIIALVVNLALLYPMYLFLGLFGPAVAFLLSRLMFTVYLGYRTSRLYEVRFHKIVQWPNVAKVLIASLVGLPILAAGKFLVDHLLLRGAFFGAAYFLAYLIALRFLGVWDAFATSLSIIRRGRLHRTGTGA